MKQVTMHEAKTHLSRLVDMALAGEDVVIARRDRPLVRLAVLRDEAVGRQLGVLPGLIAKMDDRFNEPLEDWEEAVEPVREKANVRRRRRRVR